RLVPTREIGFRKLPKVLCCILSFQADEIEPSWNRRKTLVDSRKKIQKAGEKGEVTTREWKKRYLNGFEHAPMHERCSGNCISKFSSVSPSPCLVPIHITWNK